MYNIEELQIKDKVDVLAKIICEIIQKGYKKPKCGRNDIEANTSFINQTDENKEKLRSIAEKIMKRII